MRPIAKRLLCILMAAALLPAGFPAVLPQGLAADPGSVISMYYDDRLPVTALGLSDAYLRKLFVAQLGMSPKEYLT